MTELNYLTRDGLKLAYRATIGVGPTLIFCPGFLSDMHGSKALAIEAWCLARGQACLLFDYSGHGASEGRADAGTIERWRDDVLGVMDALTTGGVILVGSSMGGWLALLAAIARPQLVQALLLIAPAPDFTDWGVMLKFDAAQLLALERERRVVIPSIYGPEPYIYTRALIDSGTRCALLNADIALDIPIHILHGTADPDVPWHIAVRLMEKLTSPSVQLSLIKNGDHRLSRPEDIATLLRLLESLL
jgi:pimeloyl-ACP methyl ester carboxylesterase